MTTNSVGRRLVHPLIQGLIDRKLQIYNRTAALAYEVVVGPDVGIEAIERAAEIDLLDQPLLDQNIQVSVHCTHTEVRELPLQPFIDPVRRGMAPRTLQQLQDPLPLPASLVFGVVIDICTPDK